MIITTNDLNNIETKITTPQIEGIEFINTILTEGGAIINASYNDIMAIIEVGKLPIIVYNNNNNNNNIKEFIFILNIFFNGSSYRVECIDNFNFTAENATTNMAIEITQPLS